MSTHGMNIRIEAAPGYEPPGGIRIALEKLAEAIAAEADQAGPGEVEGFAQRPADPWNPLAPTTSKYGPIGPLQAWCIGGYEIKDSTGEHSGTCNWVFSY